MNPHLANDTTTEEGARALAQKIEKSWWDRGYHSVRAMATKGHDGMWLVRSNLVNGKPPGVEDAPVRRAA